MKKAIFGGLVFLASAIGICMLLAGCIRSDMTNNNGILWVISIYHLGPPLIILCMTLTLGFVMGLIGVFERDR